jgi:hypothetical protein
MITPVTNTRLLNGKRMTKILARPVSILKAMIIVVPRENEKL